MPLRLNLVRLWLRAGQMDFCLSDRRTYEKWTPPKSQINPLKKKIYHLKEQEKQQRNTETSTFMVSNIYASTFMVSNICVYPMVSKYIGASTLWLVNILASTLWLVNILRLPYG